MNKTYERMAQNLLAFYRNDDADIAWYERTIGNACANMKEGIDLLTAMVEMAKDDHELELIAAGPVMELLSLHGTKALRELARIAETSSMMKFTLEKTWIDPKNDSYSDLVELGSKLGFDLKAPQVLKSTVKIGTGDPPESIF
jgi:hypothetical protein